MPTIKIDIDPDSFRRLAALAVAERRPIPWQAELLLIHALGVPCSLPQESEPCTESAEVVREGCGAERV